MWRRSSPGAWSSRKGRTRRGKTSVFTGKPPDELAMLALALNELFVPLLQRQYPEITDFYLPPEGCRYRMAVVDDDINPRDWAAVIWAITTRVDPPRDTLLADNTPIDYLDFASPVSGLGSKMGIDAKNKWPGESSREWGRPLTMSPEVTTKVDALWQTLGL